MHWEGREGVGDAVIYWKLSSLPTTNRDLDAHDGFPEHLSANDCFQTWDRHVIYLINCALRYRVVRLAGDVLSAL